MATNEPKIGQIIKGDARRDAIHVAIAPVVAACDLAPGYHVGLLPDGTASNKAAKVGIVDPYLPYGVTKGERFYLFLYPQTVTSLRHEWTHPAFTDDVKLSEKEQSEAWLREAAVMLGVSYEHLIGEYSELATGDYINNGEHIRDVWYVLCDEFWKHHKIVTGRDVPEMNRGGFTCSC